MPENIILNDSLESVKSLYTYCSDKDSLKQLAKVAGLIPSVDFVGADLEGIQIPDEDLSDFSFKGANLQNANLKSAKLMRGSLEGANLNGAVLKNITWVGPNQIDRFIFGWNDEWTEFSAAEMIIWAKDLNPIDGKYRVQEETTRGFRRPLPFYEAVELIAIINESWTNRKLVVYYLNNGGNLFRLNGSSPPIHEVNAKAPILLTPANALDYLRFFSFFVRGDDGPFYILESAIDPLLSTYFEHEYRELFFDSIVPATYGGENEHGHFLTGGSVFYSNSLFRANFSIQQSGMIELRDDEPIVANLPIQIDAPIS